MKNTENADRPMSAMLYSPSRRWPLRRSGRPAQTSFSSEISQDKAFTAASSRKNRRAASENRHARCDEMTKSATCCKSDSFRRAAARQGPTRCEPVALRTAAIGVFLLASFYCLWAPLAYILEMPSVPLSVVETPPEDVRSDAERQEFVDYIARNPEAGDLIPDTGGVRKVRWRRQGMGKRAARG
jgi:hypothetical protein